MHGQGRPAYAQGEDQPRHARQEPPEERGPGGEEEGPRRSAEAEAVQGLSTTRVEVHPDAHAAARAGAERFAEHARAAVEARGRFAVALSGGGAPRETYALLAGEPFVSRIPWEGVHLFWGDERCVPPGHPRSNFGMAHRALVARVPIPPENVHRMRGELPPAEGARRYAEELEAWLGPGIPRFDLLHLGLGEDAHTASLFPFDPLLRERARGVGVALHRPLGEFRLTLTLPVLNAAARVEVLVLGAGKAVAVRGVLRGPLDPFRLPAQLVRPRDGEALWRLDRAAAARL
ncbi:MAG TPA: 6-phosphogluconolactonase [Longimicrobiaceae bacterium]|nr:6-phosphogluconolactonase [Longimicrobiaceae bacterium]